MNNIIKFLGLGLCITNLASCVIGEEPGYTNTTYRNYTYDQTQLYPQLDSRMINYGYRTQPNAGVVNVPNTYHVGEVHSPVSFKDRDRTWVSSQNPQAYTIELADDDKAALVAQKLYKAPKNDRMAQVKYQRNGKAYYKGVYGTYSSAAEAQKALDALPAEIKQNAGIKTWSSVQENIDE